MEANVIGEAAALATATLWTFNTLLFTSASKKNEPLSVNAYRIVMVIGFLAVAHAALLGTLIPNANNEQWVWLGLSGIIGLGIGDFGLFSAFVILGPRRTLLIMAFSPIFASLGAYALSGETISQQPSLECQSRSQAQSLSYSKEKTRQESKLPQANSNFKACHLR